MLIVVSRYNEEVEWTKLFDNVIIYNKGEPLSDEYNQIMLDNVGREGHTYYKYIVDNYDNLDEQIVFVQGNPFEHSPYLIEELHEINKVNVKIPFYFLSDIVFLTDLNKQKEYYPQCNTIHNTYNKVFNTISVNNKLLFGAGAQFIVSKEVILNNTKEFYQNIVKILEYDINPIEGHHIERFHYHIFMGINVNRLCPFDIDNQKLFNNLVHYIKNGKKGINFL